MSEDEDEELAMLRLQALMSKRRGGAGTSKDLLPFSLALPLTLVEPTAPVSAEAPVTVLPVVVTSEPAVVTGPAPGISNSCAGYRQPRFIHGQASYCTLSCY